MGQRGEIEAVRQGAGGDAPETWTEVPTFTVPTKTKVTIRMDRDMLAWFRAMGPGWSTRANQVLRLFMLSRIDGPPPPAPHPVKPPAPSAPERRVACPNCANPIAFATDLREILAEQHGVKIDMRGLASMIERIKR